MPRVPKAEGEKRTDAKAELLAVQTIDLLAQVEGLLREVTELQRQALRLRDPTANKPDILTLISGQ